MQGSDTDVEQQNPWSMHGQPSPPRGTARGVRPSHGWPVPTTHHLPTTQTATSLLHWGLPFHPVSSAAARLHRHILFSICPTTRALPRPPRPPARLPAGSRTLLSPVPFPSSPLCAWPFPFMLQDTLSQVGQPSRGTLSSLVKKKIQEGEP